MAGTYTQLISHSVFAVKHRKPLIQKAWKEDLYKYISGILKNKGQYPLIINGVADHIHILFGFTPITTIADIIRDIKNNSSKFINKNKFCNQIFNWQGGYSSFTVSKQNLDTVYNYIRNQESYHLNKTFEEEYTQLLKENDILFDPQFLFEAKAG